MKDKKARYAIGQLINKIKEARNFNELKQDIIGILSIRADEWTSSVEREK